MRPPVSDSATPKVHPAGDEPGGHRDFHGFVVDAEDDVAEALPDGEAHLGVLLVEQRDDVGQRARPGP